MPIAISSPLKSKFSHADRYDRYFQRSEFQIQIPEPRGIQLLVHGQAEFHVRIPEARDCSKLPVHVQAPAPTITIPAVLTECLLTVIS
jgi:hypothetical protein